MTMTIDRLPPDRIRAAAEQLIDGIELHEGSHLMALVDHALAPGLDLLSAWRGEGATIHNLIGHLSGADKRVSPLLIALPSSHERRLESVAHLLRKCNGRPMLSVLASDFAPEAVAAQLSKCAEVVLPPDSATYLLRFADTRVATALNELLDSAQRRHLFGLLQAWAYLDREAKWAVIRGAGPAGVPEGLPLALTVVQLEAFLRASMPDSLVATLREGNTEFAAMTPSSQYRLVCHWISTANGAAGGQAESGECLAHCVACLAARS